VNSKEYRKKHTISKRSLRKRAALWLRGLAYLVDEPRSIFYMKFEPRNNLDPDKDTYGTFKKHDGTDRISR